MFSAKLILAAIAFASMSFAIPSSPVMRATPTITLCAGSLSNGCVGVPVGTDECVNFTARFTFLDKEVSAATIPGARRLLENLGIFRELEGPKSLRVLSENREFGCTHAGGFEDFVVLTGGSWSMFAVPGIKGTEDFNDLTSSISCSPL
ncbi:hypothetical protein DFH06DRAFT_1122214 [Mycena polygramma]|nr:hypothetical protein DFH06DRAFT_1122214 [Mycena polygramma]